MIRHSNGFFTTESRARNDWSARPGMSEDFGSRNHDPIRALDTKFNCKKKREKNDGRLRSIEISVHSCMQKSNNNGSPRWLPRFADR